MPSGPTRKDLTHLDSAGNVHMVDVGEKPPTRREALTRATVVMQPATLDAIESDEVGKGDVLAAARVAGIMAAKQTSFLIPLCHPLPIDAVEIELSPKREADRAAIEVNVTVRTQARTGVEMEALVAASIAALTIYDMCKAIDRAMIITDTHLVEKRGGKSGTFVHPRYEGDASVL